jgi:hypothetical protein
MVRTIQLNDGKSIPALAWGNGTGGIENSGKKAIDTGAVALKAGILHIDTAQVGVGKCRIRGAADLSDLRDRERGGSSYQSCWNGPEGRMGNYQV